MFTVSLDKITEAVGYVVDGTEANSMPLDPLAQVVEVLLKTPNPLTKIVVTTGNLVEAWFVEIQLLLCVPDVLFEDCKTSSQSVGIAVIAVCASLRVRKGLTVLELFYPSWNSAHPSGHPHPTRRRDPRYGR